jgi:hypothetical protein
MRNRSDQQEKGHLMSLDALEDFEPTQLDPDQEELVRLFRKANALRRGQDRVWANGNLEAVTELRKRETQAREAANELAEGRGLFSAI